MCLEYLSSFTAHGQQWLEQQPHYKVVRRTSTPGVYANLFRAFKGNPSSGTFGRGYLPGCTYVLGQPYQVDHDRKTASVDGKTYPAGVHAYRDKFSAVQLFQQLLEDKNFKEELAIIEVKLEDIVAANWETSVALKCTPLAEVLLEEE